MEGLAIQNGASRLPYFAIEREIGVGEDGREKVGDIPTDGLVLVPKVAVGAVLPVERDDAIFGVDDVETHAWQYFRQLAQRLDILPRPTEEDALKSLGMGEGRCI